MKRFRCYRLLAEDHRSFLALLQIVESHLPPLGYQENWTGRPSFRLEPFIRAFLARSFFRIPTMEDLRTRLRADPNLRSICGFTVVPSAATFSRRMAVLAENPLLTKTLADMVSTYHEGRIVGHISRDSTAIPVRERPCNKKTDVTISRPRTYRRGRPRKDEIRPEKTPTVLSGQAAISALDAIKALNTACSWGCKKNSQGNVSFGKGYKLHLDVTDTGIPVTAIVSGANVHDSQAAIPLEKISEQRVTFLYSVMDSAYDAAPVYAFIRSRNRVPLIHRNKRRHDARPPVDAATKRRYGVRSTVERANAHLKDWLIPAQICVRGIKKVTFRLLCGVVCLAALKIVQYFIAPSLAKNA